MCVLQENVLQNEEKGQYVHQGGDLFGLAGEEVEHHVGDNAKADTLRNGVAHGHGNDGDVGRNGFPKVVVVKTDFGDRADHQKAHHDQGRSGGEGGDGGEEGGKQGAQKEEQSRNQGGETGAPPGADTRRRFHEGGHGGGTHHSTGGGADGVRHESGLDAGQTTLVVQHIGLGSNPDQGAQGIKQIHKQEGEQHNDKIQDPDGGEIHGEALAEGFAQAGEVHRNQLGGNQGVEAGGGIGGVDAHKLAQNPQKPGGKDPHQNGTPHPFDVEDGGDQNSHQG